jgi:allantoinase
MVASDHSPAPASMKTGDDFFRIWGGISGCQSLLQLLLTHCHQERDLPLATIARATAEYPAARFRLPGKGQIAVGADADLALVALHDETVLQSSDLFYRHQHSPFVGRRLCGRVTRTLLRGVTIYRDGQIVSDPIGRLIMPEG